MRTLRVAAVGVTCALALYAADFWKTKDSSQWSSEEIDKILNDSPWARAKKIEPLQDMRRRGMGGRGGIGFPGGYPGGYPGGGYPGGAPYPGGGYPGGAPYPGGGYPPGVGYPGGGGGYPNDGGNYPNGRGNGGGSSQTEPMNLTIRWDSAAPVEAALMRRSGGETDELKAVTAASQKYYVITVLGLRLPQQRNQYNDADDSDNNNRRRNNNENDALRSRLLDAAQLAPKGQGSIYAQDVQIAGPGGIDGVRFLFPRTNPISAGAKEVDFILNVGRMKVEEKFKLNDMQYEGKLAL